MRSLNLPKIYIRAAIMCSVAALLGGCSVFQPVKSESITTYSLEVQFDSLTKGTGDKTLLVTPLTAQPGFDSTRMIYIKKLHEIDYFAQNKWVDTPSRMLTPLLVQALESSAKYRAVVNSRSSVSADLRLDTEIIRLQQEFLTRPSQIRLTMRAQLIDIQGRRVLATREFDLTEVAASDDPYGGVVSANRAIKTMLLQIAEFCTQELKPDTKGNTQVE
jgi:cholesterol transport system auxiliary component